MKTPAPFHLVSKRLANYLATRAGEEDVLDVTDSKRRQVINSIEGMMALGCMGLFGVLSIWANNKDSSLIMYPSMLLAAIFFVYAGILFAKSFVDDLINDISDEDNDTKPSDPPPPVNEAQDGPHVQ